MMKGLLTQLLALLILGAFAARADDEPFVSYRHQGELSNYTSLGATVGVSGKAYAKINRRDSTIEYESAFRGRDQRPARSRSRFRFFSQPDRDTQPALHTGETEITVIEPERRRTLKFRYRQELDPFRDFFWKLIMEAEASHELKEGGRLPSTGLSSDKILRPARLKSSLINFALTQPDLHKAQQAIGLVRPR